MADQSRSSVSGRRRQITLETAPFILIFITGASSRLFFLLRGPLSESEADLALSALGLFGQGRATGTGSPGAVLITGLSFLLFGDSDASVRLPGLVAGIAAVAAMWLYRRWLGRWGFLSAAALLATSPTASYVSTRSAGAALAALLVLLSGWALSRIVSGETKGASVLWTAVLPLALLPTLGAMGTAGALVLVTYLVAHTLLFGDQGAVERIRAAAGGRLNSYLIAAFWALLLVILIGAGRGAGLQIPGGREFAELFKTPEDGYSPLVSWAKLLLYDPGLLMLGVAGAAYSLRDWASLQELGGERGAFRLFLISWTLVAALIVTLSGPDHPEALMFLLAPLSLHAGLLLEAAIRRASLHDQKRLLYQAGTAGLAALWLLISLFTLAGGAPGLQGAPGGFSAAASTLLLVGALLWRTPRPHAAQLSWSNFALAGLALGLLLNLHVSAALGGSDRVAEWLEQPRLDPFAVSFVNGLVQQSSDRGPSTGSGQALRESAKVVVDPTLRYPFEWYLRERPSLKFSRGDDEADIVVSVAETVGGTESTANKGAGMVYLTRWGPLGLDGKGLLRWFLYRDAAAGEIEPSTLFVRARERNIP